MKDGYIMQVGTPTEVFERPANLFVAEFIGAPKMNTFKAELVKENGKYFVKAFGAKLPADGENGALLAEKGVGSREVILGARPEHITLADGPAENAIEARRALSLFGRVLDDREREVVILRLGLLDGDPRPQHEVAKKLGISRSYVSRIEKKALQKLRQAMESQ